MGSPSESQRFSVEGWGYPTKMSLPERITALLGVMNSARQQSQSFLLPESWEHSGKLCLGGDWNLPIFSALLGSSHAPSPWLWGSRGAGSSHRLVQKARRFVPNALHHPKTWLEQDSTLSSRQGSSSCFHHKPPCASRHL